MALVNPQPVTLYQVGDLVQLSLTPSTDHTVPTKQEMMQRKTLIIPTPAVVTKILGIVLSFAAKKVISTSYASNEHDQMPFYEIRQCNEYMKLGLQGSTVFYLSGDFGLCIKMRMVCTTTADLVNSTHPFPGRCPSITAVEATQIKFGGSVTHPKRSSSLETASLIFWALLLIKQQQ